MVKFDDMEFDSYCEAACYYRNRYLIEKATREAREKNLERFWDFQRYLDEKFGFEEMIRLYKSSPLYVKDLEKENQALREEIAELQDSKQEEPPAPKSELDEIQPDHAIPHPQEPSNILHFTAYLSPSG